MKLKAGETFYIVFDADAEPILTKELEGNWHKVDPQEDDETKCSCRNFIYHLDDNYCAGCGEPI